MDVVDVVSGYVKLEKAGVNWRACCPFHKEKTPSFFVSRERQMWHCFGGCSEGGDIFKFIMKIENMDFKDALKMLAQKAGVTLHYENPQLKSEKDKIYDICEEAAKFFENELKRTAEEKNSPLEYLCNRGLSRETIKEFRLGFAPFGWHNLSQFLKRKGFKNEEIIKSGLAISKDGSTGSLQGGGCYDRFRSRIMFPLFDANSRIVGFTGRIFRCAQTNPEADASHRYGAGADNTQIDADKSPRLSASSQRESAIEEAKYVNTPETPIFSKGKLLYGFHKAKEHIRKADAAILVEGQMDFLMIWQDGVKNAVATSGTALTSGGDEGAGQLNLLSRYTKNLILGFDMDEAGQKASERGIELSQMGDEIGRYESMQIVFPDFNIKILRLPEGKDAADFIKERAGEFQKLVDQAAQIMDYYFERAFEKINKDDVDKSEMTRAAIDYFLPKVATILQPINQGHWVIKLAEFLKVKESFVEEELKIIKIKNTMAERQKSFGKSISFSDKRNLSAEKNKSRKEVLAERLMGLLFKKPEHYEIVAANLGYLPSRHKILVESADNKILNPQDEYLNYLAMKIDYEILKQEDFDFNLEFANIVKDLKLETIKEQLEIKSAAIKEAERAGDIAQLEQLVGEFRDLSKELS